MPFSSAPPTLLYENSAGRLLADSKGFLRAEWLLGATEQAAVEQLLEQGLHLLRQTGWGRVLWKQGHPCLLAPGTLRWLLAHWLPRAADGGSFRWGGLLVADTEPEPAVSRQLVEQISTQYRIQLQLFTDEAQAEQWLLARYG